MDDLAKKLNDLLNSPDGMQKLQQAAASLGAMMGEAGDTGEAENAVPSTPPPEPAPPAAPAGAGGPEIPGDMAALARLLPLLSDMKSDDENTTLLKALRPYLQNERQHGGVDRAGLKILQDRWKGGAPMGAPPPFI